MAALDAPVRLHSSRSRQRALRTRARWARLARGITVALVFLAATAVVLALELWPERVPWGAPIPVAVVAGLFLAPRTLVLVDAYLLAGFLWAGVATHTKPAFGGALLVLVVVMLLMHYVAVSRSRLGVQGTHGETMLVDLRDRLRRQGEMPELPEGWGAEIAVHAAYGGSFSGDFVVTNMSVDGTVLELAVVDVSGKGVGAGTRSLLLSGAFGGLLGAMPAERFLPSANAYLIRQRWDEGFATAVHAHIDLVTGRFSIGSAGHPPAIQFAAGSGRWTVLVGAEGPPLGVSEDMVFPRTCGVLGRGDALLLYTDGVIEARTHDLYDGIDRMLGTAERMIGRGFAGMAEKICSEARAGETDDRAVVMVWRR